MVDFHTAEIGDMFERNRGVHDDWEVVEIEETFGDRVRVALEADSKATETDSETTRIRIDEGQFEREFMEL